ncbi:hypothetical protein [Flocculibacter collagenilyticus]|uniref:hypothetical protein n=1 Tax=Flocculibacter collagenilyticus TaxID=2744479 RepID=UPI0018F6FF20|nr:hypothetical protein [Flocculibacter collagenilyticus]
MKKAQILSWKALLLFLIVALSSHTAAHIEANNAVTKATKVTVFTIGVEDVPYFPLYDFNTNKDTYARELLDAFAQAYNYQFKYVAMPIKRFDKWLLDTDIDFKYPDNIRWFSDASLRDKFTMSDSTIELLAGTFTSKEGLAKPVKEKHVFGTLFGFHPTLWIDGIKRGQIELHEDTSPRILVQKTLHGHIHGINLVPEVINYHLNAIKNGGEIKLDKRYRYEVYSYHLSTIKHPDVIRQFNTFLKQNGVLIERLKAKYNILNPHELINSHEAP